MKRRDLLKFLAVSPLVKYVPITEMFDSLFAAPVVHLDTIAETYSNYVNFSNFALAAAIDEVVQNTAEELGYRAGLSVSDLVRETWT